ncbi:curli production assembly/transport protein CsgE [Hymenobacter weizhouensis]|uniref:curli production assembly/transport protein CsgE n=1 Tax=Hymenobacter sp. YIM 151500-1 TaxID=2987689 RepID=UPI002227122B|nr:curli production assembly/transport protein CsgE [Hymenobacter sp. YIM 151500-1]UYZ63646.1 curli production assembly/transport protein CsgE [Hymenobacter sp. YIM 151500-1]
MATSNKPVPAPPSPALVLWWRPWMMGLSCWLLLLLLHAEPAWAQAERKRPARSDEQPTTAAPTRESEGGAESARKLEENLRLLLRVDSLQSARRKAASLEISGLVVDQTITKLGRDFYELFYTQWEAPAGIEEFTIVISERPGRTNTTLVAVRVNDEDLLEMPLQPSYDLTQEAVLGALGSVQEFLQQQRNLSRQLEKEDRGGVGLY